MYIIIKVIKQEGFKKSVLIKDTVVQTHKAKSEATVTFHFPILSKIFQVFKL